MGYIVGVGCAGIFLVLLPAVLLWFYKDEKVRTTLEFYDPNPRWTDRCPIPVLGLSIAAALAGFWMIPAAATGVVMLFGVIVTGFAAYAAAAIMCGIFILAARLVYLQRPAGWWLVVGLILLFAISVTISWFTVDLHTLYAAMGTPDAQLDELVKFTEDQRALWLGMTIVMTLLAFGYAVYVRRWFFPADARSHGGQVQRERRLSASIRTCGASARVVNIDLT